MAISVFALRLNVALFGLQVVVGIEQGDLPVVEQPVHRVELADLLNQRVLGGGFLLAARQLVEVAERRHKRRIRQHLHRPLVARDCTRQLALGRQRSPQSGQRAVVVGKGRQRVAVVPLGPGVIADQKSNLTELPANPGDGFTRRRILRRR